MPDQPSAAFISYCRDDQEFALRLAQDLKAAGASVWLDQLDILSGDPWDTAVQDAIIAAPCVLTVLSPASARSRNVLNEISFSLEQDKVIIPVLYRDCIVPLQLQRNNRIDFRADYAAGLAQLLKRLQVAKPNQAVLDRAAEGDAQRHLAWQAREAEAQRLDELKRQEQAEAARRATEDAKRREQEAGAQRLQAAQQQEQAESDRRAREAEANYQRQLEQQQAREAAESLAAQQAAQRRQTPPAPGKSVPVQLKNGWIVFGAVAAILIVYFVFFHKSPDALAKDGIASFSSRDYSRALSPLTQACDGGNADGCFYLGVLYANGDGVSQDAAKSVDLFKKACEGGNARGCTNLGTSYQNGQGAAASPALARLYLQRACDMGATDGCGQLQQLPAATPKTASASPPPPSAPTPTPSRPQPAVATPPSSAPAAPKAESAPKAEATSAPQPASDTSTFSLDYVDIQIGTGELAAPGKNYTVIYTGYLADGTIFDSSATQHKSLTFPSGAHKVIPGWDTGFAGMHVGGKRRLFIPFQLAYGVNGRPPVIPAKAELIFDIELVSQSDDPSTAPDASSTPAASVPAGTSDHAPCVTDSNLVGLSASIPPLRRDACIRHLYTIATVPVVKVFYISHVERLDLAKYFGLSNP